MKKVISIILIIAINSIIFSQEKQVNLEEITVVSSPRIELPFSESSKTVQLISKEEIINSPANNVAELLQQVAGIDIRRRGVSGMQADLYIRGGGFDQTLLLIDGIKVEDAQTGHHTMNMALPIEVIERIEIIKGSASRIYGQNAFTGAINIITTKAVEDMVSIGLESGSYEQQNASVTISRNIKNQSVLFHYSNNSSQGHKYNTDYKNENYFLKNSFEIKGLPIDMISSFNERKFGANGFYASPEAIDQYEETQASLLGFSTKIVRKNLIIKPKLYWKRNQDMYVYLRENPSVYRNLHITNKIGMEVNGSYVSTTGVTGFGAGVSSIKLSSNNLGNRDRTVVDLFVEHQMKFAKNKIDLTPGVAFSYFSDVSTNQNYQNNFFRNFFMYPGLDVGYNLNDNIKLYSNIGYTYRVPTYTDLFYSSPTTIGNENLNPEKAFTQEFGVRYNKDNFNFTFNLYNRDASDVIDYVKNVESAAWEAFNIRDINTKGYEIGVSYDFYLATFLKHSINIGYSNIKDDLKETEFNFSRYSLNSLKNHITSSYSFEIKKYLKSTVVYKYAERSFGEDYSVMDFKLSYDLKNYNISVTGNNLFDTVYSETNLVEMPGRNFLVGLNAKF
ncbi:TonB-dependent receptor [Flavobacteriaceae bacterium]|nr:TonB-dependent receptor [Flavobacteriaceae bacterium]MDB9712566.1 TonB-dependent receptor [Flavobacteriaceae bacterium]MDC1492124.1 TonB-dependent receptor [Flavobacteriaceae bacterium]